MIAVGGRMNEEAPSTPPIPPGAAASASDAASTVKRLIRGA